MKSIKSSSVVSVIILFGILVMMNAISIRNFFRLDLTSSKMYSLSEASKNIVSSIEDKVLVKAFFTPDLPSPYNTTYRYLRDMLEDYRAYSKGHLDYEYIDPGSEEALEKEAQSFRLPQHEFRTVANDKFEAKMGYMGVAFIYGDKKETIPFVGNVDNLEYEITSLINRITSDRLPKLGITSTGIEGQQVTTQGFYEALGQNFNILPLNLDEPIDVDFDGVFLLSPRAPLTEWQLFNLDQYIMNNGKVAIFANSYEMLREQGIFSMRSLNLNRFLENYGITIGEDILIDERCGMVNVQVSTGFLPIVQQVRFHYSPSIVTLNEENIITRDLNQVQTYFPSSVDTTIAVNKGYEVEGLFYTSEHSGRERGSTIPMQLMRQWTQRDFPEKYIPIAAIVKGRFSSYFADKGPPKKPAPKTEEGGSLIGEEKYDGTFIPSSDKENRLLVVGDGHMPLDQYLRSREILLIQNIADWLVQAESLISIRSKQITLRPLKNVSNVAKKIIKWANHFGPGILVIILGIVLWQVRRFRKKALMLIQFHGVNK